MPFDAVFLSAVVGELNDFLPGCRIDKVQQPERETVLLTVRGRQGSRRLLLSASTSHPRIQFTDESFENPAQPPMFCMLLRKHLQGGRILSVRQLPMERAVDLTAECTDELGESSEKHLFLELMGRNSNLIFTDRELRIHDCLRRVDFEMSEKRQVLPGLFYREPPAQDKRDPTQESAEALTEALRAVQTPKALDRWLAEQYRGISPLIARELSYLVSGRTDPDVLTLDCAAAGRRLAEEFAALTKSPVPILLTQNGAPKDFTFREIRQYEDYWQLEQKESFSELLDAFYGERSRQERMRARSQALHKTVSNLYGRVSRKLEAQRKELAAAADRERLRQLGDIVTANLHQIVRGQARLTATNFYDPDMREIEIPLNVALSPQQNAAKFYKDYTKAKNAEKYLTGQIAAGESEQAYLASVLEELARAENERDLSDIRAELLENGYVKDTQKRKQMKQPPSHPMEFQSSDGFTIYVGRNNRQNDLLTCKAAYKTDLWLHAQKVSGSHAVIACAGAEVPERTVTEAAMLAAYYSQARGGQNVPVDCCPVRQVKKPNGARPGMVVYENYRTVYVTPDPGLPERLK